MVAASGSLLASACSSSKAGVAVARPTIATAVESTTTTNPYAVPPVIDVAYVNRVLAALDAAMGDVVRIVARAGSLTPEAIDRVKAIYAGQIVDSQLNDLIRDSAEGFPGLPSSPGNRRTTVIRLVSVRPKCLFVGVERDYSGMSIDAKAGADEQYVGLQPLDPAQNLNSQNPTGWAIVYDGFQADRSQPPDPCATVS